MASFAYGCRTDVRLAVGRRICFAIVSWHERTCCCSCWTLATCIWTMAAHAYAKPLNAVRGEARRARRNASRCAGRKDGREWWTTAMADVETWMDVRTRGAGRAGSWPWRKTSQLDRKSNASRPLCNEAAPWKVQQPWENHQARWRRKALCPWRKKQWKLNRWSLPIPDGWMETGT